MPSVKKQCARPTSWNTTRDNFELAQFYNSNVQGLLLLFFAWLAWPIKDGLLRTIFIEAGQPGDYGSIGQREKNVNRRIELISIIFSMSISRELSMPGKS